MSIYASAVKKPITTLMIFLAVVVFGIYSLINLPIDLYPDIEFPAITVVTTYNGANASDIETNISIPVEDALNSVDKLQEITSVSRDNISVLFAEFEFETDLSEAANEIRDALAFIEEMLPEGAGKPNIIKLNASMMPILFYAITADESYEGIEKMLDEKIINPLNRIEGIGSIGLAGTPIREVLIDVDPKKMEAYNMTVEQIGSMLQLENMNMPIGNIKMGMLNYPLRIEGEFSSSDEIQNIVIGNQAGKPVYLRDVATVMDSIREMSIDQRINGERGITMYVMKQSGANTVKIAREVSRELEGLKSSLPSDVNINVILDSSEFIRGSINNLTETLMFALFFVMMVVFFFLGRWRATLIIVLTIPISLIVAFIYLYITDNTINIISLSSLSIAIGMVVDDAIVVLENISKHIDRGSSPREAAIYATNEVWLAVIVTTLTVVAVFLPMTMIGGMTGVLFRQLGWIVSITVTTSTIAAITLTPMLSSKMLRLRPKSQIKTGISKYEQIVIPWLDKLDSLYEKALRWSLQNKLLITVISFVIFFGSLALATGLNTTFIPESDEGYVTIEAELQTGTRMEETARIAGKVDSIIYNLVPDDLELLSSSAGSDESGGLMAIFQQSGSNMINHSISLTSSEDRDFTVWDIAEQIRLELQKIPEIIKFNVTAGSGMSMTTSTLDVEIFGYDMEQTTMLADQISDMLETVPGARDIEISREKSKPELRFELDREKMAAVGLNTTTVAMALYNRINGLTATQYREAGDEYNVVVRFNESYRNSISDIENIAVTNPLGHKIRLSEIGTVNEYWSPPNIERQGRQRVVTVSTTPYKVPLGRLAADVQAEIDKLDIPPGVIIEIGGAYEDLMESFTDLAMLLVLSLVLVYLVMASQFESFKMPFIIMFSIPFAFTGVILALFITGTDLSVIAGLGAIMLVGIAVKNAIVLVDYINLMRDRGYNIDDAIALAGRSRLRPVLMTAMTTMLGMLPLALSTGEGSEIWSPMGISVIGGLLFSTIVTMLIVPVIYRVFARRGERDEKVRVRSKFDFMDK
ncbi:MAG: efflux RND transporter permease subunit [Bacteroidales bacterium]|nr:efflux RND transporter permease subunit [Bacteroidales bacterium]